VDVNAWSDLAVENRISVSTSSWQLPTLILFQDGTEAMRLPPIDDNGKVTKTVLDRVRLLTRGSRRSWLSTTTLTFLLDGVFVAGRTYRRFQAAGAERGQTRRVQTQEQLKRSETQPFEAGSH
jgi:hypothetical protein